MDARLIAEGDQKTIVALIVENDRCPAGDFIENELNDMELEKTTALLAHVADKGEIRNPKKSKAITDYDDVFEFLPTDEVRLLWCYLPGKLIVLLDGFRKRAMKSRLVRARYKAAAQLAEQVRKCRSPLARQTA